MPVFSTIDKAAVEFEYAENKKEKYFTRCFESTAGLS